MFEEPATQSRDRIGDWILRGGIALAFLLFGCDKFASGPDGQWVRFFEQVGVGQWFRYFTGFVEIGASVLVMVPKTTRTGLAILVVTMAVASMIHVFVLHHPGDAIITGGLCVGLAAFWWARRGN